MAGRAAGVLAALVLSAAPMAAQGDGMPPPRHTLTAGVVVTQERWDRYWEGTLLRGNDNIGTVTTQSATLMAGYGITRRLGVMAMLPYVRTRASQGTLREMRGVQDVVVEARYSLLAPLSDRGGVTAVAAGSVGVPTGEYSPDFLPLSIGVGSRRVSGRLTLGYRPGAAWQVNGSAAYTWRAKVKLDRDAYYTGGSLHLGNEVAMPNVFDATLGGAFHRGRVTLPLSVTAQRTLGGSDIRRQDMPFVSNRMDFVRVDAAVACALPARGLAIRAGAGRVVSGRNVGRASILSAGLLYTVPF